MAECCKRGFRWQGEPEGAESKLAGIDTYVSGSNKDAAVLIVHDIFGWKFRNLRLLADHYAREADVMVYVPDFFGGEVVSEDTMDDSSKFAAFDIAAFIQRNNKQIRQPEIFSCAQVLRQALGFKKVGAVGFCYGGWAVLRLAAKEHKLVDCISMTHPSLVEKSEIDAVSIPVQICAPENDTEFTPELKAYANEVLPRLGIEYDYQFFPGLSHGFATRGDMTSQLQRKGLDRAKDATVYWLQQHLHM